MLFSISFFCKFYKSVLYYCLSMLDYKKLIEIPILLTSNNSILKGGLLLPTLIKAIVATICILLLATYDFLCLCRIIGKEKWVEKIYRMYISTPEYNEEIVFRLIRPMILTCSLMTYLIVSTELSRVAWFGILLSPTPLLAFGASFKGTLWNPSKKKDDDDKDNKAEN